MASAHCRLLHGRHPAVDRDRCADLRRNLAGFAGPFAMGWIKDHTGSYARGLLLLAALGIMAMGVVLMLGRDRASERVLAE